MVREARSQFGFGKPQERDGSMRRDRRRAHFGPPTPRRPALAITNFQDQPEFLTDLKPLQSSDFGIYSGKVEQGRVDTLPGLAVSHEFETNCEMTEVQ